MNKFLFEIRQIWIFFHLVDIFQEKKFPIGFSKKKVRVKCMTKETELIEKLG